MPYDIILMYILSSHKVYVLKLRKKTLNATWATCEKKHFFFTYKIIINSGSKNLIGVYSVYNKSASFVVFFFIKCNVCS